MKAIVFYRTAHIQKSKLNISGSLFMNIRVPLSFVAVDTVGKRSQKRYLTCWFSEVGLLTEMTIRTKCTIFRFFQLWHIWKSATGTANGIWGFLGTVSTRRTNTTYSCKVLTGTWCVHSMYTEEPRVTVSRCATWKWINSCSTAVLARWTGFTLTFTSKTQLKIDKGSNWRESVVTLDEL